VPAVNAVKIPDEAIVPTAMLLLLHTPLAVVLESVVLSYLHNTIVPVIASTTGNGLTVTTAVEVLIQPKPLVTEYVIVAVPAEIAVTIPDDAIVATAVVPLVHAPPVVVLESEVVVP
jgi:hypothetical protein